MATTQAPAADLDAAAPPSPAGPVDDPATPVVLPPQRDGSALAQTIKFGFRPMEYTLSAMRRHGDVWRVRILSREQHIVVTTHPDHIKSIFTARPEDAPSITGESPLRPLLGPNSVLTSVGARHMRQRRLLLPPFHGDAVRQYERVIGQAIEREIDGWQVGRAFSLAPRMSAVTLDVIMAGIFGVDGRPRPGTIEHDLRQITRRLMNLSTKRAWQLIELHNLGRDEPRGPLKKLLELVDRRIYAIIADRRARGETEERDVLSLLLQATDEEGTPLTDKELRDELMALVLAGHETTANSLAWTFERLLRTPAPYQRLREAARAEEDADGYVEATVHEAMRVRPVIPMVGRYVQRPWRLGDYVVPAESVVACSIIGVQHREDVYPDPFAFRPERFVGRKPGTYTWIPFGGGIRRCLGASLAMLEQRMVLAEIARRTDMVAPSPEPEGARQRNVTMIPQHGGRVVVTAKH